MLMNMPAGVASLLLTPGITFGRQKRQSSVGAHSTGWGQLGCVLAVCPGKLLEPLCVSVSSAKNESDNSVDPTGCEDLGSHCV